MGHVGGSTDCFGGVEGPLKCPLKCSAEMSLAGLVMVSLGGSVGFTGNTFASVDFQRQCTSSKTTSSTPQM